MIEFINETLSNRDVCHSRLYPIYVDLGIIYKNYIEFTEQLIELNQDYYISKSNFNLANNYIYSYKLHFRIQKKLPTIRSIDFNKFLFYIEFINLKQDRAILIGIDGESSHLQVYFFDNFRNEYKISKRGELVLVSNMINSGIGIHLLNIIYEFMENNHFDQENPFYDMVIN